MQRPLYAILVDGGYITKILKDRNKQAATADQVEAECTRIRALPLVADYELLRIYYYDAYPSTENVKLPITGAAFPLGQTPRFREGQALHDRLILKPHFALRMGSVTISPHQWKLKPRVMRAIMRAPRQLQDNDFVLDMTQKGVDMRIGMDMARLALREMVRPWSF